MNKILYYLFNSIYNDGKLTKFLVKRSVIKQIEKIYKQNYLKFEDYSSFYSNFSNINQYLKLSQAAECEIKKQFFKKMALQPAILNECYVIQTIANLFNLNLFVDVDENHENIPVFLLKSIIKRKNGLLENQFPRYIYYNEDKNITLLQYGDSHSIDAIFIKDGYRIRLEIKDIKAKMGEYDLSYEEDGKLIASDNIKKEFPEFLNIIEEFNKENNVYQYLGKNYKIGEKINESSLKDIVFSIFNSKKIDLFLLQASNRIFAIPSLSIFDNITTHGSEIRIAGRNNYEVFTPKNLKDVLIKQNAVFLDDNIVIPFDKTNLIKGRGMDKITRYNINNIYYLKINNIKRENGKVIFNIKNIRQKRPTISIHIYAKLNYNNLFDIKMKLQRKTK